MKCPELRDQEWVAPDGFTLGVDRRGKQRRGKVDTALSKELIDDPVEWHDMIDFRFCDRKVQTGVIRDEFHVAGPDARLTISFDILVHCRTQRGSVQACETVETRLKPKFGYTTVAAFHPKALRRVLGRFRPEKPRDTDGRFFVRLDIASEQVTYETRVFRVVDRGMGRIFLPHRPGVRRHGFL